ncbi:MAG: potassium channel protein [Nitrospiraceae bacterium]|nr:MAG: potassium channel protein [Nitrospiraceae bacterium]
MPSLRKKFFIPAIVIITVVTYGTVGYMIIEGWNFIDSLFMTIITLTTVGYSEIHEMDKAGRIFSIVLILSGVGAMFYALGVGAKILLEGEIREILGRKRLNKKIENLKNHYIICGYGRMGNIICQELMQGKSPFVVIEASADLLATVDADILSLQGDATQDSILMQAGIMRAKGLISVLSSDANNLYVVLSARGLNPNLRIVARASEEGAEQKLIRAGADSVVSPYYIGGLRIAHSLIKPAVVDFIEFATRSENLELQMEEVKLKDDSHIIDHSLDECGIRRDMGIIIVAIKRDTGNMEFNPTSKCVIRKGDTLVVMGEKKQLQELEKLVGA